MLPSWQRTRGMIEETHRRERKGEKEEERWVKLNETSSQECLVCLVCLVAHTKYAGDSGSILGPFICPISLPTLPVSCLSTIKKAWNKLFTLNICYILNKHWFMNAIFLLYVDKFTNIMAITFTRDEPLHQTATSLVIHETWEHFLVSFSGAWWGHGFHLHWVWLSNSVCWLMSPLRCFLCLPSSLVQH